jgi:hypothetical protein
VVITALGEVLTADDFRLRALRELVHESLVEGCDHFEQSRRS